MAPLVRRLVEYVEQGEQAVLGGCRPGRRHAGAGRASCELPTLGFSDSILKAKQLSDLEKNHNWTELRKKIVNIRNINFLLHFCQREHFCESAP